MLYFNKPQALSTSLALIGVLHIVLASPPRFQIETTQYTSTGAATAQVADGLDRNPRNRREICVHDTQGALVCHQPSFNPSIETVPTSSSAGTTTTQTTTGVSQNLVGVCGNVAGRGVCSEPTASTSTTTTPTSSSTALDTKSATAPVSGDQNATATVTSISCDNTEYWAATVSNWLEEDVDAKLSSWALNLVPNPPTAIPNGSYPTQLPRIFTGFGNPSLYPGVIGIPGQLRSIALKGTPYASCELVYGPNAQCPGLDIGAACGNMPRWAYLAWTAIYNMFSVHGVIENQAVYQIGQAQAVENTFSPQVASADAGLEVVLTLLGSIMTVIGILIPIAGVGEAVFLRLSDAAIAKAAAEGGIGGRLGGKTGKTAGSDAGSGGGSGGGSGSGSGSGSVTSDDPDAIVPAPQNPLPNVNGEGSAPPSDEGGTTTVVAKPTGDDPKASDPTFIGNALWVAPGVMTQMANTIWQETAVTTDPNLKRILNSQAVANYFQNQSVLLTQYNNALLTTTDNASIHTLLSVLAGGSFIETQWSQAVFEMAVSADVLSRQINTGWQDKKAGGTYISYTQLNDNVNGTICNATHWGVRSTQVCADTGVYYLNVINLDGISPTLQGPPGFGKLMEYGIMPWWPVSACALTYRIMNPNGNVVPPIFTTPDETLFANYLSSFVTSNPGNLLASVGQLPGTWTIPVCDQGRNFWGRDWFGTDGYTAQNSNDHYQPLPCACGYQGSGTKAFYETIGASLGQLYWISSQCEQNLQTVDPVLNPATENIGWNAISGGPPPSGKIDYGQGYTATMPKKLPDPCHMGYKGCADSPKSNPNAPNPP